MVSPLCGQAGAVLTLNFQQRLSHILHRHVPLVHAYVDVCAWLSYHETFYCNPVKKKYIQFRTSYLQLVK